MSLSENVLPGIVAQLKTLTGMSPAVAGFSVGATSSIPQTPWVWVLTRGLASPDQVGSDLRVSDWTMELMLFVDLAPEQENAEVLLAQCIQNLRRLFEVHVKMGQATVARARIISGEWAYMNVNSVEYRTASLTLAVREKESVGFAA